MPFTLINIKDVEDIGPVFRGAPDLEFRARPSRSSSSSPP